jgi:hypothetical protein
MKPLQLNQKFMAETYGKDLWQRLIAIKTGQDGDMAK